MSIDDKQVAMVIEQLTLLTLDTRHGFKAVLGNSDQILNRLDTIESLLELMMKDK